MKWRTLTDEEIAEVTAQTFRHYRRPFGVVAAALIAAFRFVRLYVTPRQTKSDVEAHNERVLEMARRIGKGHDPDEAWGQAVRHIEAGMPVGSAWDEAEKYRAQLAREGSK